LVDVGKLGMFGSVSGVGGGVTVGTAAPPGGVVGGGTTVGPDGGGEGLAGGNWPFGFARGGSAD
jgi:hypothetical protein